MLENFVKRRKTIFTALACVSSVVSLSACTEAGMPSSTPMQLGRTAYAPQGYLKFCGRHPDQCGLPSPIAEADRAQLEKTLNEEQWANVFNAQPTAIKPAETPYASPVAASDLTGAVDLNAALAGPSAQTAPPLPADTGETLKNAIDAAAQPEHAEIVFSEGARLDTPPLTIIQEAASSRSAVARLNFDAPNSSPSGQPSFGASDLTVADTPNTDAPLIGTPPADPVPPPIVSPIAAGSNTIHLTPTVWAALNGVNRSINAKIRPMSDEQAFGMSDYWTLPLSDGPRAVGNCKHYALEKRKALVDAGFSPDALSIAIVRTSWGEVHAVLIVGTDQGDYVLDNLSEWIKGWREVNYTWIERQVPGKPLRWAGVVTKPMILAAAY